MKILRHLRIREPQGRGPTERTTIALGSANLDALAARGCRINSSTAQQVRFLVELLLEGKLFMVNGLGQLVHLDAKGGVGPAVAVLVNSKADSTRDNYDLPRIYPPQPAEATHGS